jgi:hypothetical protein
MPKSPPTPTVKPSGVERRVVDAPLQPPGARAGDVVVAVGRDNRAQVGGELGIPT